MMQERIEDLEIVLNEMFASKADLSLADVSFWQKKYPQFARELAEAYADWREFEFFVLQDEKAAIIDAELSENEKKTVQGALAVIRSQSAETITDLRSAAEKAGVTRENILKTLGVSETFLRKIERRNLKEIPRRLEEKIAEIYKLSLKTVQSFLTQSSVLPNAARYKSKNAPKAQPKQAFVDAVKNDPELSEEEKRQLLALIKE